MSDDALTVIRLQGTLQGLRRLRALLEDGELRSVAGVEIADIRPMRVGAEPQKHEKEDNPLVAPTPSDRREVGPRTDLEIMDRGGPRLQLAAPPGADTFQFGKLSDPGLASERPEYQYGYAASGGGKTRVRVMKKAAKPAKITAAGRVRTKSEVFTTIAEHTGLARKQVAGVFDVLGKMIAADLSSGGKAKEKAFVVPGMMKINAVYKPAMKGGARPNPFKPGEMMVVMGKPARVVIKVRPLKSLKAMI